ncbi:MAG: carboxypeptidase regulatory-like domain-containing protein [Planctomycetes bacterium]|nr:carboxypeptidase regulatory-like domain-containing protein [Planctomycetota bacterium]
MKRLVPMLALVAVLVGLARIVAVSGDPPDGRSDAEADADAGADADERGLALTGVALDPDGRPVAGVLVRTGHPLGRHRATTGPDGRFLLDGLPEAEGDLLVSHDAWALAIVQHVVPGRDPVPEITLALEPALELAGQLVWADGRPAPDVALRIEGDRLLDSALVLPGMRPTWESRFEGSSQTSDAEGRFRFEHLYRGAFDVVANVSGAHAFEQRVALGLPAGRDDLRLVLDPSHLPGLRLLGTVRDAESGEPVDAFTLTTMRTLPGGGGAGRNHVFEHTDGRFDVAGVLPGPIEVQVRAEGYVSHTSGTAEYTEGEHELAIGLVRPRDLTLRVVDDDGRAVAGAELSFEDDDGRRVMPVETFTLPAPADGGPAPTGTRSLPVVFSDPEGRVVAHGLPARRLDVVARHPAAPPEVEVRAELDLRLGLDPEPTIVLPAHWTAGVDFNELELRIAWSTPEATIGWDPSLDDPLRAVVIEGKLLRDEIHALDGPALIDVFGGGWSDVIRVEPTDDGRLRVRSNRDGERVVDGPAIVLRLPLRDMRVGVHMNEHVPCFFDLPADAGRVQRVALLGR